MPLSVSILSKASVIASLVPSALTVIVLIYFSSVIDGWYSAETIRGKIKLKKAIITFVAIFLIPVFV